MYLLMVDVESIQVLILIVCCETCDGHVANTS